MKQQRKRTRSQLLAKRQRELRADGKTQSGVEAEIIEAIGKPKVMVFVAYELTDSTPLAWHKWTTDFPKHRSGEAMIQLMNALRSEGEVVKLSEGDAHPNANASRPMGTSGW